MSDFPYSIGNQLRLCTTTSRQEFDVKIEHLYEPSSMSMVARVSFASSRPSDLGDVKDEIFILKAYDRRFAIAMHKWHNAEAPGSVQAEVNFFDHLLNSPPTTQELSGDFDDLDDHLREEEKQFRIGRREDPEKFPSLSQAAITRVMQKRSMQLAERESTIYERLQPLQDAGRIPRYFCRAELVGDRNVGLPSHLTEEQATTVTQNLSIPVALMSFVQGVSLSNIGDVTPKCNWKRIVHLAMDVINEFGDYDVLNSDTHSDDIIIQIFNNGHNIVYKAVAIDLAQARLRRDDETYEEWKEAKCNEDEETAIGFPMYKKLELGEYPYPGPGQARYEDGDFVVPNAGGCKYAGEVEGELEDEGGVVDNGIGGSLSV